MRVTLRQLQIFLAIADHGSTTAAAVALPLSQSATSNALGELETLLGAPLFDRIGKRLQLNETGRALLDPARAALDAAEGIERDFGIGLPGAGRRPPARIRLGASTTIGNYLIPPRIAALQRDYPEAAVELRIGNTRSIVEAVLRREVDAGVIEGPAHEDTLEVEPWLEDPLVMVCAPTHPLVAQRCDRERLRQTTWLLRETGSGTREAVEAAVLPHLGRFSQPMQLGSTEAIKQAAAVGLGVTCLSVSAVSDLMALGRLVELSTDLPPLRRTLFRVRHRDKRLSPALLALLDASVPL